MEWRDGFLILCLTGMLFQLDIIPCTDDQSIVTYVLQMGRDDQSIVTNILQINSEGMVEGKAVNASQAFNYCKLMVMICKEAMAGNHSLRSCTYQKKKL
ncbi:hypothetical protein ACB098_11G025100 [Castanea mollissima]